MSDNPGRQTQAFQTEVRQLLKLMIHSLYSNREIFLRELISNASDAADKLRFEAIGRPELLEDRPDLEIRVEYDADAGTLSVSDNGVGMTREDVIRDLGTIARSGTAEFLQQMTGDAKQDARLIGQFGVGFYSAFTVASSVTVETRRAGADAAAGVRWESDGAGEFAVEDIERAERGTRVTLQLKDDAREFAEALRLETLIRRYSDHIAFPVKLSGPGDDEPRTANSATALWTRIRAEIGDDEYREFYKHLSHDYADPLTWSHRKVEGKREYTSLLYLPSVAPFDLWNRDAPRGLKLYVQRVFIMDDVEQFLPLYLRFVKGVVDSSDLPLNVSRELLQDNPALSAMKAALTRRVLDMLDSLARDAPDDYATFWSQFGQVLKEGLVEDREYADRLLGLLRFTTTRSDSARQDHSLADYVARMPEGQDRIYYLLADSYATARSSPHLEALAARGFEVLLLHDRIDPWMADHLPEYEGKRFHDISRGKLELPEGDGEVTREVDNEEHKALLKKVRRALRERVATVNVSRRLVDSPACVITPESELPPQLRRMLEAAGQDMPDDGKPELEINVGHPLIQRLEAESDDARFGELANIVLDHALLAGGSQLEDPAAYVRRMHRLLLALEEGGDTA